MGCLYGTGPDRALWGRLAGPGWGWRSLRRINERSTRDVQTIGMANDVLIGIAGVHYVAMELSRRGMIALPTVRNIAAYDIVALNVEGTRHANIQVKASSKRVTFFPMPQPSHIRAGIGDYYVLVRWIEPEQRYEGFLLTGREARAAVKAAMKKQDKRIGPTRKPTSTWPVVEISANPKKAERWAQAWLDWSL